MAYTKRTSADVHEPCDCGASCRVAAVMIARQHAPAANRIVANDAASIAAEPSAMRHRSELAANATSAAAVRATVRTP